MQTLTTHQMQELREKNRRMPTINVLSSEEFLQQHIPGSINIPLEKEDFESQVERSIGNKSKPLIVYCASHSCDASSKAAKRLEEAGFENVYDYEGGMKAWQEANLAVASGS